MHLVRQESLVFIFKSSRLALFNSMHTDDEVALYDLIKIVHVFVIHIDGFSRARQIVKHC